MGTTCSRHQLGAQATWGGAPGLQAHTACRPQDVLLMIRCHKTAIFSDTRESSIVFQLKGSVQGILKRPLDDQLLDDSKTLGEVWLHQPDSTAAGPSGHGASLPGS
ncbi:transcription elongation factor B polypeptide 2-like protein [Camelus ferus]|nr:transcription elongation factor B polypeptide 2-like protein [Camelus ferus]